MIDEFIEVNVPVLNITTWAKNNPEDIQLAIVEATILFCITSEKFGSGIESELNSMGL